MIGGVLIMVNIGIRDCEHGIKTRTRRKGFEGDWFKY